jgi:nucleoside-diphosphate-sugar epimerase
MNRLLVTGATGFLGLPSVLRAAESFAVHAAARKVHEIPGIHFHAIDLFDAQGVSDLIEKVRPTHLLHLAWIATPGVYWTSPENYTWVDTSRHLLEVFARHGGKRAVIAGSCAEYHWGGEGVCREQLTPLFPTTPYGRCKNELRTWTESFGKSQGVEIAWARLFFLHGPREHPARLVPSIALSLLAGEAADCSEGKQQRDFLHTADLADALVTLLESSLTGPVNVGSGVAVSVREVVERVARLCGRPELVRFGARPTPPNDPPLLVADVTRLRDELGWRPRYDLERGLEDTVEWWRARRAA